MFESAVVNASPLIYLGRTGNLRLIEGCARIIDLPDVVLEEIRAGQAEPAVPAVDAATWLKVVSVGRVPSQVAAWNLGAGESAVLAWAVAHPGTTAIIDDREGRRCAGQLGVKVVGTVGLVLAAKRRGLVPRCPAGDRRVDCQWPLPVRGDRRSSPRLGRRMTKR